MVLNLQALIYKLCVMRHELCSYIYKVSRAKAAVTEHVLCCCRFAVCHPIVQGSG